MTGDTVEFVDQTLRDGHQSLWGMRMRAGMVTAVGHHLANTGFHVVDCTGGSQFTVLMRYLREDPFEWMDCVRESVPGVRLRSGMRPSASGSYGLSPTSILDLKTRLLVQHGITSFWIYDCLFNLDQMERCVRKTREAGAEEILGALLYGLSPVHTDAFYADKVRQMARWDIDAFYLEDAAGILTPDRAATLIPAVLEAAGGKRVEMHCHNTTGLAPLNYVEALKAGVRILHTASRPLANGSSLPSTERMTANVEALGYAHRIDRDRLEPVAEHFERVARQEGHPVGVPAEWDATIYQHQLPGGMMGTFRNQLAQHGMEDRTGDVLEEIVRVRADFGHPISATPYSQLIGTQAVLNVISGERYAVTTDEVIMFVLGHLGEPPAPFDEEAKDRILASPRAQELVGYERPDDTLEEVREAYGGAHLSDEELMRRYLAPLEDVEATRAAGPLRRDYAFAGESLVDLVERAVTTSSRVRSIRLAANGVSLALSR